MDDFKMQLYQYHPLLGLLYSGVLLVYTDRIRHITQAQFSLANHSVSLPE